MNLIEQELKRFQTIRTEAIDEMFENIDPNGIYPTTKFFERLDKANRESIVRVIESTKQEINKSSMKEEQGEFGEGYDRGIRDALSVLESITKNER